MPVMRTPESPAYPLGELIRTEQPIELHDPPFAMHPLRLDGVQPRTLFRQKATYDPHSLPAVFDLPVVPSEPPADQFGDVPAGVVPDEKQNLLAELFELLQAPREELRGYGAYGSPVHEPQPYVVEGLPGKVEAVAGDGLRLGVVLCDRPLDHAAGVPLLGEGAQGGQGHPAPPAFVLKADGPLGVAVGHLHQPIASEASLFSFVQGVGRCDPPLRPHPAYPQKAREGGAYGLPRDPPLGESRLEGRIHALGGRGAFDQSVQTLLVEGADGVSDRLRGAPEVLGYLGWREAAGARQKDLGSAHHESVFGAHPGLEAFALVFRQFPNKNWRFHGGNYSPSRTQPSLIMH